MPQHVWVREFTGGLDTRRMPETTPGGVLIQAADGHITRGGEFEVRAAFVPAYTLPAGTVSMAYTRTGLVVFGSGPEPDLPSGVTYQRLQHPDGTTQLRDVPSFDLYRGKIYAVGVFANGSRHHFYDGVRVEDWFDGRARAWFLVTGGGVNAAVPASATFTITGGSESSGNQITSITVNSVTITSGAVAFDDDATTTAAAVAADINSHTSSPDYFAESNGASVTIFAVEAGAAANGLAVAITVGGDVTVDDASIEMAGGSDETVSSITSITVNGVPIIFSPVEWRESNSATAQAIADAIVGTSTDPEYTAFANGGQVVIEAATQGESENGKVTDVTVANGFEISNPAGTLTMRGGAEQEDTFDPGTFVRTLGSKMYALSGPNMHFSGVQLPTGWTTDNVGAGAVDLSTYSSGAEELKAIADYQGSAVIFSESVTQIWYIDPDPTLNRKTQVLKNTGTFAPRSVTQFGDSDVFYLNESGLRSLRARDSSNSASTTDIGNPVDELIVDVIAGLSVSQREEVIGLIEPRDGRFWLIMRDRAFVFSFFGGSKISAWSTYNMVDSNGDAFTVEDALVFDRKVYLRAGNTIYAYGGIGDELQYDATEAVMQIPYLDGDKPWQTKELRGFDAAGQGMWKVYVAQNPNNLEAQDAVGVFSDVIADTTYNEGRIPAQGRSTHFSLIFKKLNDGYAKLGSCVIHYEAEDENKE